MPTPKKDAKSCTAPIVKQYQVLPKRRTRGRNGRNGRKCDKIVSHHGDATQSCVRCDGEFWLLLLLLVVHQASAVAACLSHSHAILVTQLVGLLHELLHLLHDGLVLLLVLLLVGHLRLLIAGRIVRHLLLLWLLWGLIPGIGYLVTSRGLTASALLCLAGSFFQFLLKFVK